MAQMIIEVEDVVYPTDLPEEDGLNLESDWHRMQIGLLVELISIHHEGREDYFAGGNMFIHFDLEKALNKNFRGPDFFYVRDARLNPPRRNWTIWQERGRYPDLIIELTSPSTADIDHTVKKAIYEQTFRTPEYLIYDPADQTFTFWRLNNGHYVMVVPNEKGWIWSKQLELWLGNWEGKYLNKDGIYLRFFDQDGKMIPTAAELAEAKATIAEAEKKRAEDEKLRADSEKSRADNEKLRADSEKLRADAAEAELARLRAMLSQPKAE